MDTPSLTQQGIDAYQAGNKEEAIRLLSEAIRANRDDENAWLYLGAAIDDPERRRQAFQQVLRINPANEKAKAALERLGAPAGAAGSAGASAGAAFDQFSNAANQQFNAARSKFEDATSGKTSYKIPFDIPGKPESVTIPFLLENARTRIRQAIDIFTNQNFEQIVAAGQNATMWDAVFTGGVGIVAIGLGTFLGHLIGWPMTVFHGGFGGFVWIFVAPILAMLSSAAGFAAAIYASEAYLENQGVGVMRSQHAMYYAMIFLPIALANAVFIFATNALGFLDCLIFPVIFLGLAAFAVGIYGLYLQWKAFERVYGTENNRGLITAAIALGGYVLGNIIASILGRIVGSVFGSVFHVIFTV